MMGFISVRRIPQGCVLQHIKGGLLGTNTITIRVQIQKAGSHVRAPPEKWGMGVLGTGKTRESGIKKWYYEKRGY